MATQSAKAPRGALMLMWAAMLIIGGYFLIKHAVPKLLISEAVYTDYYWNRRYWLFAHVVTGLSALLLGPLQFVTRLRQRRPLLHRWSGRVYLVCTLVAATTAVWLAFTAPVPQPLYAIGLYGVSGFWLVSGWQAWRAIRQRQLARHRAWMIRNYATTFFFVLFFALYDSFLGLGWPAEDWANALTWSVWLGIGPPLLAVELALRRPGLRAVG
jgi:uncharacterized membrane protein